MSITQTTLLGGPAVATFNGHTFFAYDGILVTPALELAEVDSDTQGPLDQTVSSGAVTIKFTPSVPFADLVALYPWTMASPGTPLFGPTDSPLVLTASNGVRLTFAAAAIVQMPDLTLGKGGPVTGALTFMALGARSLALTAPKRVVAIDAATPGATGSAPQLPDDFVITWGGSPWVNLRAADGVRVEFVMKTTPVLSDANSILDVTLDRLEVRASFAPATPGSLAEIDLINALQLQGASSLPGRPLSATAEMLAIAGNDLSVQLPLANVIQGGLQFDATKPRFGELTFVAERALLATAMEPLATLADGGS